MTILIKQSERFTETEIDEEIVVMRLDNGEFFSLAGTAAVIWRLLDGTRDRSDLIATLAAEFDGPGQEIASDVGQFLGQLEDAGLIAEA